MLTGKFDSTCALLESSGRDVRQFAKKAKVKTRPPHHLKASRCWIWAATSVLVAALVSLEKHCRMMWIEIFEFNQDELKTLLQGHGYNLLPVDMLVITLHGDCGRERIPFTWLSAHELAGGCVGLPGWKSVNALNAIKIIANQARSY